MVKPSQFEKVGEVYRSTSEAPGVTGAVFSRNPFYAGGRLLAACYHLVFVTEQWVKLNIR